MKPSKREAGKGVRNENRLRNVPMSRKTGGMNINPKSEGPIADRRQGVRGRGLIPNTLNRQRRRALLPSGAAQFSHEIIMSKQTNFFLN